MMDTLGGTQHPSNKSQQSIDAKRNLRMHWNHTLQGVARIADKLDTGEMCDLLDPLLEMRKYIGD